MGARDAWLTASPTLWLLRAVADKDDSLTHLDDQGRARMVDVGHKDPTRRTARAEATVVLAAPIRQRLMAGDLPKGEALSVARVAGIQAAKETARLIPLCHPLGLDAVEIAFDAVGDTLLRIEVVARCTGPTGVEMEAMTAASVAALTVYDMCKGLDKGIEIGGVRLLAKTGGKSGDWQRESGS